MGMMISNEADFMIHGVVQYELFGQELWLSTTTVCLTIITVTLLIFAFIANRTDVYKRQSLEWLNCENNKLSSLDMTGLSALQTPVSYTHLASSTKPIW